MSPSDEPMNRLISANPVNAEQLIACWSDNDAKALLLAEIMETPVDGGPTRAT